MYMFDPQKKESMVNQVEHSKAEGVEEEEKKKTINIAVKHVRLWLSPTTRVHIKE